MHKKIRKFTECFITKISRLRVQCFWFSKSQKGLLFIDYSIRREGTNLPNAFSLKNKAWHGCLIRYKSLECNHFISFLTRQTGTFLIEKYKRTLALPSPQNQGENEINWTIPYSYIFCALLKCIWSRWVQMSLEI